MATVINGIEGLTSMIGVPLGTSEPLLITQERVNLFADATGDHQWIHVDPDRAKAGPFGTTIAHGYLTLSILPELLGQILTVTGVSMGVNYGANKIRFPSPVPVGATVTASASIAGVKEIPGGAQVTMDTEVTVEGASKPSMVAQLVFNYYA
ncbi:MAG: MaoC family dehydratase [Acidimicrobiales bacterium]